MSDIVTSLLIIEIFRFLTTKIQRVKDRKKSFEEFIKKVKKYDWEKTVGTLKCCLYVSCKIL